VEPKDDRAENKDMEGGSCYRVAGCLFVVFHITWLPYDSLSPSTELLFVFTQLICGEFAALLVFLQILGFLVNPVSCQR